jgi:hypothetical protein
MSVHPDVEYKKELANFIEINYPTLTALIHSLRIERTEEDIDDWKFFCKTTDILDKHRKTSIINYIPELEPYWIKA